MPRLPQAIIRQRTRQDLLRQRQAQLKRRIEQPTPEQPQATPQERQEYERLTQQYEEQQAKLQTAISGVEKEMAVNLATFQLIKEAIRQKEAANPEYTSGYDTRRANEYANRYEDLKVRLGHLKGSQSIEEASLYGSYYKGRRAELLGREVAPEPIRTREQAERLRLAGLGVVGIREVGIEATRQIKVPPGYSSEEISTLHSKYYGQLKEQLSQREWRKLSEFEKNKLITGSSSYQAELQRIHYQPGEIKRMQEFAETAGYARPEQYGTPYAIQPPAFSTRVEFGALVPTIVGGELIRQQVYEPPITTVEGVSEELRKLGIPDIAVKGYEQTKEGYERAEEYIAGKITRPVFEYLKERGATKEVIAEALLGRPELQPPITSIFFKELPRTQREIQKGMIVGILEDVEEKPIKQIALVGVGRLAGYGIVGAEKGLRYFKVGEKAITITGKVAGVGMGGLFAAGTAMELAEAETPREVGEKLGVIGKDVYLFAAGMKDPMRRLYLQREIRGLAQKLPVEQRMKFHETFKEAKTLRGIRPKVKTLDLSRLEAVENRPRAQEFLKEYFVSKKDIIVGGSVSQQPQVELGIGRTKRPTDIDLYIKKPFGWAEEVSGKEYAREIATGLRELGLVASARGGKVSVAGEKFIEFHPYASFLKLNIEQVTPIWFPARRGLVKTPEGIKILRLGIQAPRKVVGYYLEPVATGKVRLKDLPAYETIKESLLITKEGALKEPTWMGYGRKEYEMKLPTRFFEKVEPFKPPKVPKPKPTIRYRKVPDYAPYKPPKVPPTFFYVPKKIPKGFYVPPKKPIPLIPPYIPPPEPPPKPFVFKPKRIITVGKEGYDVGIIVNKKPVIIRRGLNIEDARDYGTERVLKDLRATFFIVKSKEKAKDIPDTGAFRKYRKLLRQPLPKSPYRKLGQEVYIQRRKKVDSLGGRLAFKGEVAEIMAAKRKAPIKKQRKKQNRWIK